MELAKQEIMVTVDKSLGKLLAEAVSLQPSAVQENEKLHDDARNLRIRLEENEKQLNRSEIELRDAKITLEKERLESGTKFRTTNQDMICTVERLTVENHMLKRERDEYKQMVDECKKQPRRLLPVEQGQDGEDDIETCLRRALGPFMNINNTSKKEHEMDLEVTTVDGQIRIRIEIKNYTSSYLPDSERAKFFRDIDGLQPAPTAAILFMRCGLRMTGMDTNCVRAPLEKRGNTDVYQIGCWSKEMLLQTIHEICSRHIGRRNENDEKRMAVGSTETKNAFDHMSETIAFMSEQAIATETALKPWRQNGSSMTHKVAEHLRQVHSTNPSLVTQSLLTRFESKLPKRTRARSNSKDAPKGKKQKIDQKSSNQ
jgi:hypothetical protein